ncbi:MAG: glycoside hydrolase family 95 protein [Clostridia bacterium]|nr:glycoside hydrolase family 95 protein [Clostridia bacterium]
MENKLRYASPATCFEEALPLGNGSVGAMVYGCLDKERISLNHDTLWSGKPRRITRPNAVEAYHKGQQLVLEDKIEEATWLLEREFSADYGQSYMPLGNLYVETKCEGKVGDYIRELDMENGILSVRYTQNGIHFAREYFVSNPDNCVVVHITSDKPVDYVFSADCQLKSASTAGGNRLYLTGECPTAVSPSYAKGLVPTVYDGEGVKFAAIGATNTDGKLGCDDTIVTVSEATEVTFIMCIETSYISFDVLPNKPYYYPCEERVIETAKKSYTDLRDNHVADHKSLYSRVKLDLGFAPSDAMTVDRILSENKDADLGMVELLYNFGRYLVIAASREGSQATNLQGIWNEQFYPAWSSNYTVNINTEMNYWPVLMSNLAGLDMPVIDLIRKISVTGADAAKDFYGAKGYCCHHNIDLWGLATPVGCQRSGCLGYAYWNMSSGWLCRHLWEHYEYTLDVDFLRDTAYPLMKGAAEFYLDTMIQDGDHYIICPTTSPENAYYHTETSRVSLARHAAMTQGILMDLFGNLSEAAKILGIDDDFVKEVRAKLPTFNTYEIGSEGQLLEYDKDYKENDIYHRHTSHLYGLYPGESITTEATPELAEACRVTLQRRGDVSTGWSMGWRVCLWAKLKDGDHSLQLVKNQLKFVDPSNDAVWKGGGTYANLFDAHPPFQIDGNYGVCAGITLMLLQCENGKIRILPALPSDFKNGSVSGLKAKGDITVDIVWENNALKSYSLESPVDQTVTVATPAGEVTVDLVAGKKVTLA